MNHQVIFEIATLAKFTTGKSRAHLQRRIAPPALIDPSEAHTAVSTRQ